MIYNKNYKLQETLENVECWNLSKDNVFDIKKGIKIRVLRIYDSFHTTIQILNDKNEAIHHPDNKSAYRFIINNTVLSDVINVYIPTKTQDFIGDLIAS